MSKKPGWILRKDAMSADDFYPSSALQARNRGDKLVILKSHTEWLYDYKTNKSEYYKLRYSRNHVILCKRCNNSTRSAYCGHLITHGTGYLCVECVPWHEREEACKSAGREYGPTAMDQDRQRRNKPIAVPCRSAIWTPKVVPVTVHSQALEAAEALA